MLICPLVVVGCVVAFTVPGLCCHPKEYTARDGQCCPMCREGTVVHRDCTLHSGTQCAPCQNGTYMNQPNGLNKCFPCSSCDPVNGVFVQRMCTVTTDTVCEVLSGYFCKGLDDAGCRLAEKHTVCAPGQRTTQPGTSRSDTVCVDCQPGYFSQDGVNCTAWTACTETQVKVKEGSRSSDVVCDSASRKQFCYLYVLISVTLELML